ncbi:MAG: alpha/beta hydrolase [Acidobacteriota bacterium]
MSKPYCLALSLLALSLPALVVPALAVQEVVLRPDLPAGEELYTPEAGNVHVKSPQEQWVRKVKRPVMEVYLAPKPNGTAVVVAPGGGWNILAIEHEGRDVAKWLNDRGVSAFVLRYRVGLESREASQKACIEDGLLAVKTVRQRAAEWKLDPKRIGVMGFSAGGYLTVGVATQYTAESRPDFAIPIYAVSPDNYTVPADAPPLFVAVAQDDNVRMTSSATALMDNWKKAKLPVELHVFADGGHGFGMNKKGKSCDAWTGLLADWMQRRGLLVPAGSSVISLRPDLPISEEVFIGPNDTERRIRKVTSPTLTVFQPVHPNGAAIIVAPGGGFVHLAIDKEGTDVAQWMSNLGFTAFLLKYRVTLADRDTSMKASAEDGLLAMKHVREHAAEWHINPAKIGIVGFSAGGYVAAAVATSPDPATRANFAAPVYAAAPAEITVPAGAPPLFLAVAHDDSPHIVDSELRLYTAWKKAKVPAELHIFPRGGHGFGMRKSGAPTDSWTDRFTEWLRGQALLSN